MLAESFLEDLHPIIITIILDIFATLIIFLFSVGFNNSSFYDPYWSIAPSVILFFWICAGSGSERNLYRTGLIMILVIIWSVRLTWNWIRRWDGMKHEDWRYMNFRKQYGKYYWFISFLGIHLFPTLVVLVACLPAYPSLTSMPEPLNMIDIIAALVTFTAIVIETIADRQLRKFLLKKEQQPFLKKGLWKYSRHPNYFGEVLFWLGLFLFSLNSDTVTWWTLPGPVLMVLLFVFISIPMIDRRMLERKQGYDEYYRATSAIVPWVKNKLI
ncbi:MAG: hypothetical protein AMS27_12645 [Bacteroides sp. SM23_62_1]|nr:MAG: hypothetical protein AMS27_12645 [Bacteroides sp. SM23_62_1]